MSNPVNVRSSLIAALRSGQYGQSRYLLRTANGRWCPLGIATDIIIGHPSFASLGYSWSGCIDPLSSSRNPLRCYRVVHTTRPTPLDPTHIPSDVVALFGFTPYELAALEALNDLGYTFAQIADTIESGTISVPEWDRVTVPADD